MRGHFRSLRLASIIAIASVSVGCSADQGVESPATPSADAEVATDIALDASSGSDPSDSQQDGSAPPDRSAILYI